MLKTIGVGSELDSYCGKCKMTLNHAVVAMVDGLPRRVRCLTCQSEHNHRMPKPKGAGRRSPRSGSASKSRSSSSTAGVTTQWRSMIANWDADKAKTYSIYETFEVEDLVTHVKFGNGIVIEIPEPDRMIAFFETGEKMLMQGKKR